MKKMIVLLLLVAFVTPVFADDALVLPQGVARIRIVPILTTVSGTYDDSGSLTDNENDAGDQMPDEAIWALGGAFEYGITNQISLGIRWAPAFQFFGDADATGQSSFDVQTGGFEHADIGAEFQVLGEQGYVTNEQLRFSVTPGFAIPMPVTTDWKAEGEALAEQEDAILPTSLNTTELQAGMLLNFDYVINDVFEVNLFTEGRYRFARTRDVQDFYNAYVNSVAAAVPGIEDPYSEYELTFGPNFLWEAGLEPKASFQVADPIRLDVGLTTKFTLNTAQETTTKATFADATQQATLQGAAGGSAQLSQALQGAGAVTSDTDVTSDGDTAYTLRFEPSVGAFITALPVPLELTAQYSLPLLGQNTTATQSLITQLRVYVRF